MKYLLHFLNPFKWWRAQVFKINNDGYDKSTYDLELHLYSKLLKNDMLHYGYFNDPKVSPEEISLQQLEDAQVLYSQQIIDQIKRKDENILDAGCGMGGLAKIMIDKKFSVEVLTPNKNQIEHIKTKYPFLKSYHSKFENLNTDNLYGTLIHSESLQYIDLDCAFKKAKSILKPTGQWIITDYFRTKSSGMNKSGHELDLFLKKAHEYGWTILHKKDITENVLPTLKFINMYVERFLYPLKHFAFEKLRYKNGRLYFMTEDFCGYRSSLSKSNCNLQVQSPSDTLM